MASPPRATSGARKAGVPCTSPVAVRVASPEGVGDAEVADQRGAVVGDQDVARLDVAVHDARRVGRGQRRADLGADLRRLLDLQRPARAEQGGQGDRGDELHDQQGWPSCSTTSKTGHRVRVVQPGRDPRLAHRPLVGELGLLGVARIGVRRNFTATRRCSRSSQAAQTVPMPPVPSSVCSRYRPPMRSSRAITFAGRREGRIGFGLPDRQGVSLQCKRYVASPVGTTVGGGRWFRPGQAGG